MSSGNLPLSDPFSNLGDASDLLFASSENSDTFRATLGDVSFLGSGPENKGLLSDPEVPEEDLTDIFTDGAPFKSATVLEENFINDLDFGNVEPSEFGEIKTSGCRNSVSL